MLERMMNMMMKLKFSADLNRNKFAWGGGGVGRCARQGTSACLYVF